MDFFASQDDARRKTSFLLVYFALAVLLIVVAVYAVVAGIFFYLEPGHSGAASPFRQPDLFGWVAAGTLLLVGAGSLYKILALSGGGAAVATALGGRKVTPGSNDPHERQLLDTVAEMAIASGSAVPPVYLLDDELGINAFAAGFTTADAVISVTRGAATRLSRDELQGVVAHEFSHILNGDMRLNLQLIGVLNGILLIALVGRGLLRGRSTSRREGGGRAALLGLALVVVGYVGVFFAKLIKSAVSREREFLADASAVQFTRHPDGIAGALKKIGGLAAGSRIVHARAEETSHMFFGNALGKSLAAWLATHPPLAVRIARIDPSFDGQFPQVDDIAPALPVSASAPAAAGPKAGEAVTAFAAGPAAARDLVRAVGRPGPRNLAHARALTAALPDALRAALREPFGARAVVYSLLLAPEGDMRKRQIEHLQQRADSQVCAETSKLLPAVTPLPAAARLPLAGMTLPALRDLSDEQYRAFRDNVRALIRADNRVDLFEYALQRVILRRLDAAFARRRTRPPRRRSARETLAATEVVLGALAHCGRPEAQESAAAFGKAVDALPWKRGAISLRARDQCGFDALDRALDVLEASPPAVKKTVLDAATACVLADERAGVGEIELLRAVADALDCPVPLDPSTLA